MSTIAATDADEPVSADAATPVLPALGEDKRRAIRPGLWLARVWLAVVALLAVTADWLPIKAYDAGFKLPPHQQPIFAALLPGSHEGLSWSEPLGADQLGRSMLSRIIYGGRVTLAVGVIAMLIGLLLGGVIGLAAGYFGGKVDGWVTMLTDSALAFPQLILLLGLRAVLKFNLTNLVLILAVLTVPTFIRLSRSSTIAVRDREYVLAARAVGAGNGSILFREILPNVVLPVASFGFIVLAALMIAEGSLSFLGLGVPPPQPSWGSMIADGKQNLQLNENVHEIIIPVIVLFVTVLACNVVGDSAREKYFSRRK